MLLRSSLPIKERQQQQQQLLILSLVTNCGSVCQSVRQSTMRAARIYVLEVFLQSMQSVGDRLSVELPFCHTNLVAIFCLIINQAANQRQMIGNWSGWCCSMYIYINTYINAYSWSLCKIPWHNRVINWPQKRVDFCGQIHKSAALQRKQPTPLSLASQAIELECSSQFAALKIDRGAVAFADKLMIWGGQAQLVYFKNVKIHWLIVLDSRTADKRFVTSPKTSSPIVINYID